MSYYQPSVPSQGANNNTNGFYQPSQQYSFPQGSMAFGNGMQGSGADFGGAKTNGTPANFTNEQLAPGLFNALSTSGYSFEPSLLEELGINFKHIIAKTKFVLVPLSYQGLSKEIQEDSDLAGPIIFWLLFGILLLSAGKVHFGYIYGVALFGSLSLHMLLKYMTDGGHGQSQQASSVAPSSGISYLRSASILGYAFLPLCVLAAPGVFTSLNNTFGYILGLFTVLWSTWSSSGLFTVSLDLHNVRILIAYPLLIFYSVFALMAIFV
ncbi:unnamed protein product [Kluyveromyces dobzhanskii CBS 2104]|uniref:Protein YIP n=1 Tax=Kluyveromyces dobzhanskii CBS 2104 TaxID=1427455 RepID=A0A0A8LD46_9SACH|nr:unnamed protein product [Kluyveromyces dobzhanskii CBS 2104]